MRTRILPVVLLISLIASLAPLGLRAAEPAEPLPPDDPYVQAVVLRGTQVAAAHLNDRPVGPIAEAEMGGGMAQTGGAESGETAGTESPPEAIEYTPVEGFAAYDVPSLNLVVQIPEAWEYVDAPEEGLFGVTIPGEFAFSFFDSFGGTDFPSLLGLVIFQSQADVLVEQFGDGTTLLAVNPLTTVQGLPGAQLVFSGDMGGLDVTGAMYLAASGSDLYAFVIVTTASTWADIEADTTAIVENLTFGSQTLAALTWNPDAPTDVSVLDDALSFTVPAGWLMQTTNDPALPVLLADPSVEVASVLILSQDEGFSVAEYQEIRAALIDADASQQLDVAQEVLSELLGGSDMSSFAEDFVADPQLLAFYEGDNPTIRFGGSAAFDDFEMAVLLYLNFHPDSVVVSMNFGELEKLLASEEQFQQILGSVQVAAQ